MATPNGDNSGAARGLIYITSAVAQFVAPLLIGIWLDGKYGWSPWGLIAGGTIGAVGGIAVLVAMNRKLNRELRDGGRPPAGE